MLNEIRERVQGIIAIIILFLVGIPFVIVGGYSYFDTSSKVNIAEVNGIEIARTTYQTTLDNYRNYVPVNFLDDPKFKRRVVDSLIGDILLQQALTDAGFRLSDNMLRQKIAATPSFQRDGSYDPAIYAAQLRAAGRTHSGYERRLRQEAVIAQLQEMLTKSQFVTEGDLNLLLTLTTEKRRITHAIVSAANYSADITHTEDDIVKYYEEHKSDYQTEEQARIVYLLLRAEDLISGYQPTEDEIRRAYETSTEFVVPAKRRVSHILITLADNADEDAKVEALTKIKAINEKIKNGAGFTAVAKTDSQDGATAANGGDIGYLTPGLLPKELDAAIQTLKPGEVTRPIRTAYGYHLAKLTDFQPEKRSPLDEVHKTVVERLRRQHGEGAFFKTAERLRNLVYEKPDSLEPVAKELKLDLIESGWFSRKDGAGITKDPRIVKSAFSPEVSEQRLNSEVIELNPSTFVVLRIRDHRPSGNLPLERVRSQIRQQFIKQRAQEKARSVAQALLKQVREDGALSQHARKFGASVQPDLIVTRQTGDRVDPRLQASVFAQPTPDKGPVFDLVQLQNQDYAVYGLIEVTTGNPTDVDPALVERLRRQLEQRRGQDYLTRYLDRLRKTADITVYEDQL